MAGRYSMVFTAALLAGSVLLAACDQPAASEDDGGNDAALDAALTELLTRGGQRGLSNFILPASDDLASIPQDPASPLTPDRVALGRLLFHETALATNPQHPEGRETYACVTCHHAGAGFQAGRRQGLADGGSGWGVNGEGRARHPAYRADELDVQPIRSPAILNSAYQQVMFWDGALGAKGPNAGTEARWMPGTPQQTNHLGYEGVESQAIAGLRVHRMGTVEASLVATHPTYTALWALAFPGASPSVETAGLAIAAYERTVLANQAPFQRWLRGETDALTTAEKRGALVFFGKAGCERCHTGPALNQMAFYALGMPDMQGTDVVNPAPENLGRGGFLDDPEQYYTFKVPQLYNLKDSPFYGHGGSFRSIRDVVEYYNGGIPARPLPDGRLSDRFVPLNLTPGEIDDLVRFLTEALYDPDLERYVPPVLPSGNCTPANDPQARIDLGC